MLYTTFQRLKDAHACQYGYQKLAQHIRDTLAVTPKDYGMQRPIALATIADSNGLDDTLWVLRRATFDDQDKVANVLRSLACDFAEHVLPIFEVKYPEDKRPRQCIEAVRRWVAGDATWGDVVSARAAAAAAHATAHATAATAATAHAAAATAHAAYAAAAYAAAAYAAAAAAYAYAATDAAAALCIERQWQLERVKQVLSAESDKCAAFSESGAFVYEVRAA